LRFLGIILRVLRLEVSVYIVYITNQFQTTCSRGGGGGVKSNLLVKVTVNSKEENSKTFVPITSTNSVSVQVQVPLFKQKELLFCDGIMERMNAIVPQKALLI
jgi:hypothetical protein